MAKVKINRYVTHKIPSIDVLSMSKKKIDQHGKFIIKLDGKWLVGTSDIKKGFQEYLSNPENPKENKLNQNCKPQRSLILSKNDYEFNAVIDYSLDLRHLIDYCDDNRLIKTYFKTSKGHNYCFAVVKINFENNTKEMREYLYRPEGFSISYLMDGKEQTINYIRYKRTASGAREGSCLFIARDLYQEMMEWSCAGIDPAIAKRIDSVSWEAYIALTLSSIETTITLNPRQILFVKDQESVIKHGKAFEIANNPQKHRELISNPRTYSDDGNDRTIKTANKIWDGEGLIDDSLFSSHEILNRQYRNKCMLLLRGKLFKACVFRTHIQKWFADHGITDDKYKTSDLNGYTQAKKISDIKYIIPYSCLKFIKFKDAELDEEVLIKNWITNIAGQRNTPLFGIIKADKKSKLMNGEKVFTTYQMLNTLGFNEETAQKFLQPTIDIMSKLSLSGNEGAKYVKDYLDQQFFCSAKTQDKYGEESYDSNDSFKIFHYKELTASKLLEFESNYYMTPHYKHIVESLLLHLKKQVMDGRVMIDGVYATLFCNGIELLEYAINKEYNPNDKSPITIMENNKEQVLPVLKKTQIYSKRFEEDIKLLCARNPHITMGNFYLATNKVCQLNDSKGENLYDKYFVLSDEIVCVNAIDSDIMNILNGCDFDSDTMLITNNEVMLSLLQQQLRLDETANKFRVPFNNVDSEAIMLDDNVSESEFMSKVDDKLSNNLIGEIVNLSQRLNSLIWMLAPQKEQDQTYFNWNKWKKEIGQPIYQEGCCTLAVLSNIEIDSAKRSYCCDTNKELSKIRSIIKKDYAQIQAFTSWLDKGNYHTPDINDSSKVMGHDILGLDPMGYIIKVITSAEENTRARLSKPSVDNYEYLSDMLKNCNISKESSNCDSSLDKCLSALVECYDYLHSQNAITKSNRYYKRNYVKDCLQISQCCNSINKIFFKNSVSSNALLWSLIELAKDTSCLIKSESKNGSFIIVDQKSSEYQNAPKSERHDRPLALLWAALFCDCFDEKSYLIERL